MMRRKRRPDDGRYTPADAATWRSFAAAARRAAEDPTRGAAALFAAGRRAVRAVPPPGGGSRSGPFVALILLSQTCKLPADGPRLVLLAEEIEAALDAAAGGDRYWVRL